MAPRKTAAPRDPDRFIAERGGTFQYKRRVPAELVDIDDRAPHVRISLKTRDVAQARHKRDALEAADDAFWASLLNGDPAKLALRRYEAAVARAQALGFLYRPVAELANARIDDVVSRLEAIADERTPVVTAAAVLGVVDRPKIMFTAAFQIFLDDISRSDLVGKSEEQKRQWRKTFRRAINTFLEVNGDMPIDEIEREHAIAVYNHWATRIAPKTGRPSHTASSGNRDLGNLRRIYRDYYRHLGQRDRPNVFADLNFSEKRRARRPPFPTAWIRDRILAPGALAALNDQARAIVLAIVETGMRPSEACNIGEEGTIVLDAVVPHVVVRPREDPDDPRETKTSSSIRIIPLVGVSLAVFRRHPHGFPRYREKEATLSSTVNKHLRTNGLLPTPKHVLYSLRHSFEDRMKDGSVDAELRKILMGHALDRPAYGEGGSLEWRQAALSRIALPFDPVIVGKIAA